MADSPDAGAPTLKPRYTEARLLGDDLLDAQRDYLPQFGFLSIAAARTIRGEVVLPRRPLQQEG